MLWQDAKVQIGEVLNHWEELPVYLCDPNHLLNTCVCFGKKVEVTEENTQEIFRLVQDTITAIYPKYYPKEVVDFFLAHHSEEKIRADIKHEG